MIAGYVEGLLLVHFAQREGVVDPDTAAEVLREAWRRDAVGPGLADRLAAVADLPPGRLLEIRERARRESVPMGDSVLPEAPGTFGGRYRVIGLLGQGGMGTVYEAEDGPTGRRVALKTLRPPYEPAAPVSITDDDSSLTSKLPSPPAPGDLYLLRARLEREVRTCAHLEHPAVIPLYDAGRTPAGNPYYVMRLVKTRRTLADAIAQSAACAPAERLGLLDTFLRVCDAVGYAHAQGVLHRDLKPDNIGLGEFGEVWVMDWGLAGSPAGGGDVAPTAGLSAAALGGTGLRLTNRGAVGTPGYVPPELLADPNRTADPRSDVYALGVILAEILTHGRGAEAATGAPRSHGEPRRSRLEDPAAIQGIPAGLVGLARIATHPEPARRPSDAGALARALRAWQTAEAAARERRERRRRGALVVGGLLVVLCGLAVYLAARFNRERDLARTAEAGAKAARLRAASLLESVSGDLASDLETLGLEELRHDLLERSEAFVESLSPEGSSDQRLRAAWWIGRVERERERLPASELRGWLARGRALIPDTPELSDAPDVSRLRGRALLLNARLLADEGHVSAARAGLEETSAYLHALVERDPSDAAIERALAEAYLLKVELRGDNLDTARVALRKATEHLARSMRDELRTPHERLSLAALHLRCAERSHDGSDAQFTHENVRSAVELLAPLARVPVRVGSLLARASSEATRLDLIEGRRLPAGPADHAVLGRHCLLSGRHEEARAHLALALADESVRAELSNGVLLDGLEAVLRLRASLPLPLPPQDEAVTLALEYVSRALDGLRQGSARLRSPVSALESASLFARMRDLRETLRAIESFSGPYAPLAGQDSLVKLLAQRAETDPLPEDAHDGAPR